MKSKGQVFIIAAIIFGSLLLLTYISYQQIVLAEPDTNTKFYFQSALDQQSAELNTALSDENSINSAKKSLFSFNSFVKTQSVRKDIEYSAFQLVVLPEKETAVVINYRNKSTDYSFYHGSWNNNSIDQMSTIRISIPEDRENFTFEADALDISERFTTSNPVLIGHVQMISESETWRNYILR